MRIDAHLVIALLVVAWIPARSLAADAAPRTVGYHVAARYAIGGAETGYDYLRVDPETRRLFVAHGTRLEVLDVDTGAMVGHIDGLAGVHGADFVQRSHRGFATNGTDRTVTMFDPRTLAVLATIKYTGVKPDSLQFDDASGLMFVVNGGSTGDLSVIDPATAAIVGTIDLRGGKLEQIAFDGKGNGFVNDEDKNVVHVFDSRARKLTGSWPLAPGEGPTGMAIDLVHHRLFAACGNHLLVVVDTESGHVIGTAPIGPDPDGAAFDAKAGLVFTSNRDGTLTVVGETSAGHYVALQTVTTAPGARTLAVDAKTGRLFLPFARFGAAPTPTKAIPEPHPPMVPGSFGVLVVAP